MPFDNPYFPSQFDVGTAGAGHMHFSNTGSMTLYGPDGVTVLFSLDPVNGVQAFKGTIRGPVFETVPFTVPFQSGFVRIGEAAAVGPGRPDLVELWPTIAFTPSQPAFLEGEHSVSNGFDVVGARFDSGWPGVSQLTRGIVQVGSGSDARPQDSYAAMTALTPTTNGSSIAAYGDGEVIARADITRLQDWSNPHKEASWDGTTFAVGGGITATGGVTAQAEVYSQGAAGGLSFDDRNAGSGKWEWYSHDNVAALWNVATGDAIQVVNDGTVTISAGSLQIGTSSQRHIGMFNNSGIMRNAGADPSIGFPDAAGQWSTDAAQADIVIRTNGHSILFNQNGGSNRAAAIINPQGGFSVGRIDNAALGLAGAARIFMSVGVPPNGAGANGDFCFRYDTPGTANTRLYTRSAGVWVGIL